MCIQNLSGHSTLQLPVQCRSNNQRLTLYHHFLITICHLFTQSINRSNQTVSIQRADFFKLNVEFNCISVKKYIFTMYTLFFPWLH